jgi:hypothetical protein
MRRNCDIAALGIRLLYAQDVVREIFYTEYTDQTGPIARIAPNHLVTSSPELWTRINAVRSPYTRASWYYHAARFEPGKDNVFTECDNSKHDARRKKLASGVSPQ